MSKKSSAFSCNSPAAEVAHDQLTELSFEADGELQRALNEADIKIMEFAYDRELRVRDRSITGCAAHFRSVLIVSLPPEMQSLKRASLNSSV
jgi:hypothetical protein